MYIAHKCIKCNSGYVEYELDKTTFECSSCDVIEDEATFWRNDKMASYESDLEQEIENCYPYRELDILGCTIDLAIGYHIMDRIDARDFCMKSAMEQSKKLKEKWQLCYCNFTRIERYIERTEKNAQNITTEKAEDIKKHFEKIETAKVIFKDFAQVLKQK